MKAPTMTNSLSLGNVLTALTVVVAAAVAWGAMQQDVRAQNSRMAAVEGRMEQFVREAEAVRTSQDARLRALEVTTARVETRIDAILQGVERIETRLERMERP